MERKVTFKNSKSDILSGIISSPSSSLDLPIVILCHGFTSNKNSSTNLELTKTLNKKGIATCRFDFFGHNESKGDFAEITITEGADDILNAIKFLRDRGYSNLALVGSSFGGIASLIAASKTHDLTALVAKSPVSDHAEVERLRKSEKDIEEWKSRGHIIHNNSKGQSFKLNYTFWQDLEKNIVYDIASDINIPTLIVHGTDDEIVSIDQSRRTSKLIPHCKLVEIQGANHKYSEPKYFKQMILSITGFLTTQLLRE